MYVVTKDINRMTECYDFIKSNTSEFLPNEILCVFDIDNTITIVECKYSYWPNVCKWRNEFDNIKNKYKDVDTNIVYTNLLIEYPARVLDNDIYDLFEKLNCKKLMLTASLAGKFGNIDNMEEYRYNILSRFNISFESEFNIDRHIFDNFEPNFNSYPSYYKGILFSNGENGTTDKGKVLRAFLKKVNFNPKCIILIDDNPTNHKDLFSEFFNDIEKILNIIYTGANSYCPNSVDKNDFITFWDELFKKSQDKKRTKM